MLYACECLILKTSPNYNITNVVGFKCDPIYLMRRARRLMERLKHGLTDGQWKPQLTGITAHWTTNTVRSFGVACPLKSSAESASEDTVQNFATGTHVGQSWWNLLCQDSAKRMRTFKMPRNQARWYYKHTHSCIRKRQSQKRLNLWCDMRCHRKTFCKFLHSFSQYFYCNCGLNYF